MYEPKVTITAKLQNSLKSIEEIRDLVRTIPVVPIIEERIQHEALVDTVYYTAKIEGNPLDIRAAERIGSKQLSMFEDEDSQTFANIYKVMDFIKHVAEKPDIPIDEEVIKQIHAFIIRDIPSQGSPGVYKLTPNAILDKATKQHIFLPPNPSDTPNLMNELTAWLTRKPLAIHPIMVAGVAHLELVAIHPFDNGNGRTARALADLILYRYGYSFRYLFSWVRKVGIDMDVYHRKLREVLGVKYGDNSDFTMWVEYFADSVAKSLDEKKPMLISLRDDFVAAYNIGEEKGLSRDQIQAIACAAFYGYVTTGVYMKAAKLSRATVVKRLTELVDAGIMRVEGKGRNVRYVLTGEAARGDREHQTVF